MLIGYGESMLGESPEECADRFRAWYGISRGILLAHVMRQTAPGAPIAAYYRTVASILCGFAEPRQCQILKAEPPRVVLLKSSAEKYTGKRAKKC